MTITVGPPCDEGIARAYRPQGASAGQGRAVLATTVLGSSLAFIDGSVVNVALPALQSAFDAPGAVVQWVMNAYLLLLGALVLVGGVAAASRVAGTAAAAVAAGLAAVVATAGTAVG